MHKVSSGARALAGVFATAALLITLGSSAALAASPNTSFGFNAPDIQGFPSGAVALTGGGTFNASTGFVHAGGGFSCTADVGPGVPLTGCLTGQGVRWDTDSLLSTTMFRCNTQETARPAFTSEDTVVLHADFYRAGDANDESFTANMIVTTQDLDAAPGIQNVWVQGTVAVPQPCLVPTRSGCRARHRDPGS